MSNTTTTSTIDNREMREKRESEVLNATKSLFSANYDKIKMAFVIFAIFVINLFAVSVSLQCNRNRGILAKVSSALFAFMFGLLYILVNYYMYRVVMNKYPCQICSKEPFPF